ncbi:MAG: hypothetical protein V7785_23875 [Bermanella sp.]
MKRLYYLADSIQSLDETVDDLHEVGIGDQSLHVLGRDKQMIKDHKLHMATAFQELDISYSTLVGAASGLTIGLSVLATIIMTQSFSQAPITQGPMLLSLLLTVFMGTLVGGVYGSTHKNHNITRFSESLSFGKYLLMIDTQGGYESVSQGIIKNHKGISAAGSDELLAPAFA